MRWTLKVSLNPARILAFQASGEMRSKIRNLHPTNFTTFVCVESLQLLPNLML